MRRAAARAAGLGRAGRCPSPGRAGPGTPGLERRGGGSGAAREARRARGRGWAVGARSRARGPPGPWRRLRTRPRESVPGGRLPAPPRRRRSSDRPALFGRPSFCLCVFVPLLLLGAQESPWRTETGLWFEGVRQLLPKRAFLQAGQPRCDEHWVPETRGGESAHAFCRERGWPVGAS